MSIIDSIRLSGTTYQIQVTVDAALDSGSTNPVANSAITTALDNKVNVVDNEVPDYNVTSQITYQGGYPSQSETASTWADATIYTLRYDFFRTSDTNYTTTAAVIDPSGNITTGSATVEESIRNPLPDYINMVREDEEFSRKYYFTAKEGYRIAHLDINYQSTWGSGYGNIIEERVETVFEGGQSADVIKDVIEPALINKQDQLVSGTNIKTINNESILGSGNIDIQGGGKAIEAGRGISITTGETADTVSFNLPISAGTGTNSIAEGNRTTANGNNSHAEGYYATTYGSSSHAEGTSTTAGGDASHAEGSFTEAYGDCSHTEGWSTVANNQSEHASGQYNNSVSASTTFGDSGNTLFSVGNGTPESARHNAFEIRQNGDIYISSGGTDIKLQDHLGGSSITVDTALDSGSTNPVANSAITTAIDDKQDTLVSSQNIKTINNQSILGSGNINIQGGGKAIEAGRGISITTGETADTVSFNLSISAGTGTDSIAEGNRTTANGNNSHAEGYYTTASGSRSHAEGYYTTASGTRSHAEGDSTTASGTSSHAEGGYTIASASSSHAEGDSTTASGEYSHTEGFYTKTTNQSEHASGQYNNSVSASTTFGDSGNTLFSVGNGTADNARHNAFEIRQNGDIYLSSGGTDIKLQDHLGGGGGTVESAITSGSTNAVESKAIWSATTFNKGVLLTFNDSESTNYPEGCTKLIVEVAGSDGVSDIDFFNDDEPLGHISIDNRGDVISVNVRFDGASYEISGTTVIITYQTVTVTKIMVDGIGNYVYKAIVEGAWVNENTYMKPEVDAIASGLQNNINSKLDATAYTPTVVDSALNVASTNPVQNQALYSELRIANGETETTLTFEDSESTNYPNGCTKLIVEVAGSGNISDIGFFNDDEHLGNIHIDNRGDVINVNVGFDGASYEISGTTVIITYPTVTSVTKIRVDGIGNYVYKAITSLTTPLKDQVAANTTALGGLSLVKLTQAQYNALSPNYDSNKLYVIVN